jgi:predicted molibdopterin-dependent oxidoreductase YjgC
LPLVEGSNTIGAAKLGFAAKPVHGDVLYVMAGDDLPGGQTLPKADFTVVQAAYQSEWTEHADVVLPAQVWTEKHGHVTNVEGRELPVVHFTQAPKGIPADDVALGMLTIEMGKPAEDRVAVTK